MTVLLCVFEISPITKNIFSLPFRFSSAAKELLCNAVAMMRLPLRTNTHFLPTEGQQQKKKNPHTIDVLLFLRSFCCCCCCWRSNQNDIWSVRKSPIYAKFNAITCTHTNFETFCVIPKKKREKSNIGSSNYLSLVISKQFDRPPLFIIRHLVAVSCCCC